MPALLRSGSDESIRLTISRMTSLGVKCSPASSLACSEPILISSSKTYPIWVLSAVCGDRSTRENWLMTLYQEVLFGHSLDVDAEAKFFDDVSNIL